MSCQSKYKFIIIIRFHFSMIRGPHKIGGKATTQTFLGRKATTHHFLGRKAIPSRRRRIGI